MTTPTPSTPADRLVESHRAQLHDLIAALKQPCTGYVRLVILDAILGVFERTAALLAPPRGISDTSGDDPETVARALFPSEADVALLIPQSSIGQQLPPNGIDPPPPRH